MPLFEYKCTECNETFEELVSNDLEKVTCPKCSSEAVQRQLSGFACGGNSNGSSCNAPAGSGFR